MIDGLCFFCYAIMYMHSLSCCLGIYTSTEKVIKPMDPNGNCQYSGIANQLNQFSGMAHQFNQALVRFQIHDHLTHHHGKYNIPLDEGQSLKKYLAGIMNDGEWGDHLQLQAAADLYGYAFLCFVISTFTLS